MRDTLLLQRVSLSNTYYQLKHKLTCQFTRGAKPSVKDAAGHTALERAMEMGAITDEELFILLVERQ